MSDRLVRTVERVVFRITNYGVEIDAHWNYFNSLDDALEYLDSGEITKLPNCKYGFVKISKEYIEQREVIEEISSILTDIFQG